MLKTVFVRNQHFLKNSEHCFKRHSSKKFGKKPADNAEKLKNWYKENLMVHGKLLGRASTYKSKENVSKAKKTEKIDKTGSKDKNDSKSKVKTKKIEAEKTESTSAQDAKSKVKKTKNNKINSVDNSTLKLDHLSLHTPPPSVLSKQKSTCSVTPKLLDIIDSVLVDPVDQSNSGEQTDEKCIVTRRPSVTKILDATMPPAARAILERWKANQIAILGIEGFNQMQQETLQRGSALHLAVQTLLSGRPESEVEISSVITNHWKSIRHVFTDVSEVRHLEGQVVHQTLHYTGYFDCIAQYKDKLCLIDWKTSTKQKPYLSSTFDNPLQLAAYAGAVNSDDRYDIKVKECLLVIAYGDGSPAHALMMSPKKLEKYWLDWRNRVKQHWQTFFDEKT